MHLLDSIVLSILSFSPAFSYTAQNYFLRVHEPRRFSRKLARLSQAARADSLIC